MKTEVNLKIADTIIRIQSNFALQHLSEKEKKIEFVERFTNFFYNGRNKPQIDIKVNLVKELPRLRQVKNIFITRNPSDSLESWRMMSKGKHYIYKCPLEEKQQVMLINDGFDKITAYLLPKKDKGWVFRVDDIIYDFLQVLLISYFSLKKKGVFAHSIGIRDLDGRGLLFAGKSGAGKSTMARLWHKHSKAMVLNDDRIIVRKLKGKFFIHGSPWHGDFSDYLSSRVESAALTKLFFIFHSPRNNLRRISEKEAFALLYPAIFSTFWDKMRLENIISFCQGLVKAVPCYYLGFKDDKRIIQFVRGI